MAGNDVVGALYYKVVLDPRDYAKGVTQVKSEQAVLARAISSSVSDFDRLQAELDAIGAMYIKSSEEHRQVLQAAQAEIIRQMEEIVDAEEKAAKIAEQNKAAEAEKEQLDAIQLTMDKLKEKESLVEQLASLQVKASQDADKEELKSTKDKIAEEKRLEKSLADFREKRHGRRFQDLSRYFTSIGRLRVLFKRIRSEVANVNGGLSKLAGNLAQAAGMSPAIQGMARAFGAMGLKVLALGAAFTALLNFLKTSVAKFEQFRKTVVKLEPLLGRSTQRAQDLLVQMMDLSIQAGYSSESMFQLAESLLNVGAAAITIEGIAKTISGLAGGDEERLKSIAKAYSDVMMKGRLMGQEALQFANAGVPIYKALADHLNKNVAEVRKMSEEGLISAQMMSDALIEFGETRDVAGQMEKNMRTVSGQLKRINGELDKMFIKAGDVANGPFVWMITKVGDLLQLFRKMSEQDYMSIYGGFQAATSPLHFFAAIPEVAEALVDTVTGGAVTARKEAEHLRDLQKEVDQMIDDAIAKQEAFEGTQRKNAKQLMGELRNRDKTERQIYKAKLDEMVLSQEITQQQSNQLQIEYDRIAAIQKQREERKAMLEEEMRAAEQKVKDDAAKKKQAIAAASAKAGGDFSAGSKGEFNFLRDLLMGRRQNSEELKIMKSQEQALKEISEASQKTAAEIAELSVDFVGPVLPVGGP